MKKSELTLIITAAFSLLALEAAQAEENGKINSSELDSPLNYNPVSKGTDLLHIQQHDCGKNCAHNTEKRQESDSPLPQGASEKIREGTDILKDNELYH